MKLHKGSTMTYLNIQDIYYPYQLDQIRCHHHRPQYQVCLYLDQDVIKIHAVQWNEVQTKSESDLGEWNLRENIQSETNVMRWLQNLTTGCLAFLANSVLLVPFSIVIKEGMLVNKQLSFQAIPE